MLDALFFWLAENYREELHLGGLKIAGILCSYADLAAIGFFAKICDSARAAVTMKQQPESALWRYRVLALFALLTPLLLLPQDSTLFFVVQFLVLGLPYLLLVQIVVTGVKPLLIYLSRALPNELHPPELIVDRDKKPEIRIAENK